MTGKVFYHKLIRDLIPEKIAKAGAECETRVLEGEEYERALIAKIEEEGSGVAAAASREELIEELADVQDVIDELKKLKGISDEELSAAQRAARAKKGGFEKRLFLVWSSDDGYQTNEKRNG